VGFEQVERQDRTVGVLGLGGKPKQRGAQQQLSHEASLPQNVPGEGQAWKARTGRWPGHILV
jgi:hypothetical protein